MTLGGWKQRALQNAVDRDRPIASLLRWPRWLFACATRRPAVVRFATGGLRMRLLPRLTGFGSTSLYIKRDAYEPELRLIARFIRPGDVVIDIGASFGVFALFMAHRVGPGGIVHAFEPGRFSHEQLLSNLAMNAAGERVIVHKVAASDAPDQLKLYHVGGAPVTFSVGSDGGTSEDVPAARVDAVVPAADQARVTFIKIDVEGYERVALEGARAILETARPVIMFEVSASALRRSDLTPAGMYRYLATFGYAFHRFTHDGTLVPVAEGTEGNIIALPA